MRTLSVHLQIFRNRKYSGMLHDIGNTIYILFHFSMRLGWMCSSEAMNKDELMTVIFQDVSTIKRPSEFIPLCLKLSTTFRPYQRHFFVQ